MNASTFAVLFAGELRAADRFEVRANDLLEPRTLYDSFISTDERSRTCFTNGLLARRPASKFADSVRWIAVTPDPMVGLNTMIGPINNHTKNWRHLIQWWRLQHAWQGMEQHEGRRGALYSVVIKLRTDLLLPTPLTLFPPGAPLKRHRERLLFMRGDWFFWGMRSAMAIAVDFLQQLPLYKRVGDRAYLPIPWRELLEAGPQGLADEVGFWQWQWYPQWSAVRPFGLNRSMLGDRRIFLAHVRANLEQLKTFEVLRAEVLRAESDMLTGKPQSWPHAFPENEKLFFYHVVSRGLRPWSACIAPGTKRPWSTLKPELRPSGQPYSLGERLNRLLLWERKKPFCDCECNWTVHEGAMAAEAAFKVAVKAARAQRAARANATFGNSTRVSWPAQRRHATFWNSSSGAAKVAGSRTRLNTSLGEKTRVQANNRPKAMSEEQFNAWKISKRASFARNWTRPGSDVASTNLEARRDAGTAQQPHQNQWQQQPRQPTKAQQGSETPKLRSSLLVLHAPPRAAVSRRVQTPAEATATRQEGSASSAPRKITAASKDAAAADDAV